MSTNILKALVNIKNYGNNDLNRITVITNQGQPRINRAGDPLDAFFKDSLCNSFSITDPTAKRGAYLHELSHLGTQNNPPDCMIRAGDAFEVKTVRSISASIIALNSSYPRQKLIRSDTMLTEACRNAETWSEKDIAYCVGHVINDKLKVLIIVYGDCYAARAEVYEQIRAPIIEGLRRTGLPFTETRELGRLNGVDPLRITDVRIRGMSQIAAPIKVFSEIIEPYLGENDLSVFAIMKKAKYLAFPRADRANIEANAAVLDIKIPNPDNPQQLIEAKLVTFNF